ncbi:hypothetical protein [Vibrio sp. RM-69-4]|uniref:hypothetical protein n=1 Tax=Vibrio sp. RM-69-4 TaxID=2950157 RepID=UPI00215CA6A6|nr:hypothetical protein [Vibrio sp. RM-69-4]MCR9423982.1 hypothetical protein [Vibrio sp. RM-69-4]
MDNIVKKMDDLIDSIAEYIQDETAYTVQRKKCSDFYVPTTEIMSGEYELALVKPMIYMMPMNDAYAQMEFCPCPANVFREKSISKLCKDEQGVYEFFELKRFLEQVISGLEKSKEHWINFYK